MSESEVFTGPYLHKFELNIISVFSSNTGKYGWEKTPDMDNFHAMLEFPMLFLDIHFPFIYVLKKYFRKSLSFESSCLKVFWKSNYGIFPKYHKVLKF